MASADLHQPDIFLYLTDQERDPTYSYGSRSGIVALELARILGFAALRFRNSPQLLIHEKCPPGDFVLVPLAASSAPAVNSSSSSKNLPRATRNLPSASTTLQTVSSDRRNKGATRARNTSSTQTKNAEKANARTPAKRMEKQTPKNLEKERGKTNGKEGLNPTKKQPQPQYLRHLNPALWQSESESEKELTMRAKQNLQTLMEYIEEDPAHPMVILVKHLNFELPAHCLQVAVQRGEITTETWNLICLLRNLEEYMDPEEQLEGCPRVHIFPPKLLEGLASSADLSTLYSMDPEVDLLKKQQLHFLGLLPSGHWYVGTVQMEEHQWLFCKETALSSEDKVLFEKHKKLLSDFIRTRVRAQHSMLQPPTVENWPVKHMHLDFPTISASKQQSKTILLALYLLCQAYHSDQWRVMMSSFSNVEASALQRWFILALLRCLEDPDYKETMRTCHKDRQEAVLHSETALTKALKTVLSVNPSSPAQKKTSRSATTSNKGTKAIPSLRAVLHLKSYQQSLKRKGNTDKEENRQKTKRKEADDNEEQQEDDEVSEQNKNRQNEDTED